MEAPSQAPNADDPSSSTEKPAIATFGLASKTYCVLTGIVLPCICFMAVVNSEPTGEVQWQSGALKDKMALLLGGISTRAYYPLLLFSIIALGTLIWDEDRFRRNVWLHTGVYGGVLLASCFGVLMGAVLNSMQADSAAIYCLIGVVFFTLLPWAYFLVVEKQKGPPLENMFVVFGLLGMVLAGIFFPVTLILALAFSPWLTASAYLIPSHFLFRTSDSRRFSLRALLYLMTWLCALAATWRAAWSRALEIYSQLPTEPPPSDCFIVGAASKGHSRFVGSWQTASGRIVNRQLLRFKALELLLAAIAPSLHRMLRKIYNQFGPPIARRIRSRNAADAVFALLKPLEMLTAIAESALRVHAKRPEEINPSDSP